MSSHPGPSWPDASKLFIVSAFGRKGSGKTTINRKFYQDYPYSKICIDVNGQAEPGGDATIIRKLSDQMPKPEDGKYPNIHYIPDPGDPDYFDNLDRAVQMALYPQDQRTLVWLGEIGEFCTGNRCGPALRRLLHQNRHYEMCALIDGPRPMNIDPLILQQSDFVAVFEMPNKRDQERVANECGIEPAQFSDACQVCWEAGEYHHLWFQRKPDSNGAKLFDCPPLPSGRKNAQEPAGTDAAVAEKIPAR